MVAFLSELICLANMRLQLPWSVELRRVSSSTCYPPAWAPYQGWRIKDSVLEACTAKIRCQGSLRHRYIYSVELSLYNERLVQCEDVPHDHNFVFLLQILPSVFVVSKHHLAEYFLVCTPSSPRCKTLLPLWATPTASPKKLTAMMVSGQSSKMEFLP